MTYVLHYAPDNASLIVRMALEHRGIPYRTQLVDRAQREQETKSYRDLTPTGLIPVLETPQGPLFETAAILLWLADTHGGLGPSPEAVDRGTFLKWLFYLSNTPHPSLRMTFYPNKYVDPQVETALRVGLARHLPQCFAMLNDVAEGQPFLMGADTPSVLDFYLCAMLRWSRIYPSTPKTAWFSLSDYPNLLEICKRMEALPCTAALQRTEGLGTEPFTNPHFPNPPEGTAT